MFRKIILLCVLCIFSVNAFYGDVSDVRERLQKAKQSLKDDELVLSVGCKVQLTAYVELLLSSGKIYENNWAWQMFDASSKISSGILTGNTMDLGNFDECIAIKTTIKDDNNLKGKYCMGGIVVPLNLDMNTELSKRNTTEREVVTGDPIMYMASICIPDYCTPTDIATVLHIPTQLANDEICQTDETMKEYDSADIAFIVFIIVIGIFAISSTIYDIYLHQTNTKPIHAITLAFSIYTNGEKIFQISKNPDLITCLSGLRVFSILWVMGGHRYSGSVMMPLINQFEGQNWVRKSYSQYMQGAPVAVDTFIFITGLVMAYGFIRLQSKPNARFNVFMFYLHRYLRITPSLAVLFFFVMSMMKHISSGPMWVSMMEQQTTTCSENWWSFFLYIQTFFHGVNDLCLVHTWYLSMDMQIYLFSPLVLIPLVKYPKHAFYALIALILLSVIPPIAICYYYDIEMHSDDYNIYYYAMPYNRISPWLIGVLLGVLLIKLKDKEVKINWALNLAIWVIVLSGMTFIIYFANTVAYDYERVQSAMFMGTHRLFWAVGLMWIVFACHNGYGGFINWMLSLSLFQVMARITYSMYMIHFVIIIGHMAGIRVPQVWDDYELISKTLGDVIPVTFVSLFWTLFFESPMIVIEKILFSSKAKK